MKSALHVLIATVAVLAVAFVALPDDALAAATAKNTSPKTDIVGSNGLANPSQFSNDPQIAQAVFDSTGVGVTSTTLAILADATHFPINVLRGAMVGVNASGYETITRNGLYEVDEDCNAVSGTTASTIALTSQISYDGGSTWAPVSGATARFISLTGALNENLHATGYVEVTQTSTNLGANNVVVGLFASSSTGSITCANGGGLTVKSVDKSQPVSYP